MSDKRRNNDRLIIDLVRILAIIDLSRYGFEADGARWLTRCSATDYRTLIQTNWMCRCVHLSSGWRNGSLIGNFGYLGAICLFCQGSEYIFEREYSLFEFKMKRYCNSVPKCEVVSVCSEPSTGVLFCSLCSIVWLFYCLLKMRLFYFFSLIPIFIKRILYS